MPDPVANNDDGGGSSAKRNGPTDEGRGVARRLLQRFRGKAEEALAVMADENKEMRDERRELRDKLKVFEGTDVVVLKADDLKAYNEYKALGKPDELKKQLGEELPTLRTKVAESERRTAVATAAKEVNALLGWNPDATAAMLLDKKLDVSFADGTDATGKAVKVPHVRPTGDDKATPVPLAKWQSDNASYLTPSLTAKPATATTQQRTTGTTGNTGTTTGVPMIDQTTGTAPGTAAKAIPGRPTYQTPGQQRAASGNK